MERKSYVYKITCKITGEFYFGSSFNAKRDWYWGGGSKIRERIAQYGKENFIKEILGEFDDRTIAHQAENQYIEQFINDDKCMNKKLEHHFGSFSDETCARISAANRGKIFSEEHRSKLSAAKCGEKNHNFGKKSPMYGKHLSEETRAKMSAARLGKTLSEETKQKIRESIIRRSPWNKGKKLNKETGEYE